MRVALGSGRLLSTVGVKKAAKRVRRADIDVDLVYDPVENLRPGRVLSLHGL